MKSRTKIRIGQAVLAVVLIALVATGCGSDSDTAESSGPRMSKSAYVEKGDQICKKVEQRRQVEIQAYIGEHAPEPGSVLSKKEQIGMVEELGVTPIQREVEQLRSLGEPEGSAAAAEATQILDELEAAVQAVEEDPPSVLEPARNPFNQVSQRARRFGFFTCAQYGSV